jgi:hypothetical protein
MPRRRIQVRVDLSDDRTLWGWLENVSQQGMRIAGELDGLTVGSEIDVILVYPSTMRIKYRCSIKHLDAERKCWGAEMISAPVMLHAELKV